MQLRNIRVYFSKGLRSTLISSAALLGAGFVLGIIHEAAAAIRNRRKKKDNAGTN